MVFKKFEARMFHLLKTKLKSNEPMQAFKPANSATQKSAFFILVTVFLDMVGIGIVIPTLPDIMRRFLTDPNEISRYFGYFFTLYAAMQFLSSPLLGRLSDSFGRRPILLVSLFLACLDYLLMGFAPSLFLLFAGRILSGLSGANFTVATAYIADTTPPEKRSQVYGLIGAAFGLGFIVGPALGGVLGSYDPTYPFLAAAGLNLLNFIYGAFVLPESLGKESRRPLTLSGLNPFSPFRSLKAQPALVPLLIVHFFGQLAGLTHPSIWTLYTESRYQWTNKQVGFSLALVGVLSAFSQGYLTRIIIPKLGEQKTLLFGLLGSGVCFFLFGLAWQGWMVLVIICLSTPFGIYGPALQSMITQQTEASRQGEMQGVIVSLSSLAAIANPLVVTQLFAQFGTQTAGLSVPGAPYFFAGLSCFVGLFGVLLWQRKLSV
jgi:MFS transporter, DHA1 family, tetracycline resistance protein